MFIYYSFIPQRGRIRAERPTLAAITYDVVQHDRLLGWSSSPSASCHQRQWTFEHWQHISDESDLSYGTWLHVTQRCAPSFTSFWLSCLALHVIHHNINSIKSLLLGLHKCWVQGITWQPESQVELWRLYRLLLKRRKDAALLARNSENIILL